MKSGCLTILLKQGINLSTLPLQAALITFTLLSSRQQSTFFNGHCNQSSPLNFFFIDTNAHCCTFYQAFSKTNNHSIKKSMSIEVFRTKIIEFFNFAPLLLTNCRSQLKFKWTKSNIFIKNQVRQSNIQALIQNYEKENFQKLFCLCQMCSKK